MKPHHAHWKITRQNLYMATFSCTKHLSEIVPVDATLIEPCLEPEPVMCRYTEPKRTAHRIEYALLAWMGLAYFLQAFGHLSELALVRSLVWCGCTLLFVIVERLKEME